MAVLTVRQKNLQRETTMQYTLKYKKLAALAAALITFGSLAGGADAATLMTGINVLSSPPPGTGAYSIANLTNGSGLSVPGDSTAVITDSGSFVHNYMQQLSAGGSYTIDLGAVYSGIDMHLWNYSWAPSDLDRGTDSFSYATSLDNITYTSSTAGNLAISTGDGSPSESFAIGGSARYVRVSLLTSHGSGFYVGLNEIGFTGLPIPEPSPTLLIGLGILGLLAWRRRTTRC